MSKANFLKIFLLQLLISVLFTSPPVFAMKRENPSTEQSVAKRFQGAELFTDIPFLPLEIWAAIFVFAGGPFIRTSFWHVSHNFRHLANTLQRPISIGGTGLTDTLPVAILQPMQIRDYRAEPTQFNQFFYSPNNDAQTISVFDMSPVFDSHEGYRLLHTLSFANLRGIFVHDSLVYVVTSESISILDPNQDHGIIHTIPFAFRNVRVNVNDLYESSNNAQAFVTHHQWLYMIRERSIAIMDSTQNYRVISEINFGRIIQGRILIHNHLLYVFARHVPATMHVIDPNQEHRIIRDINFGEHIQGPSSIATEGSLFHNQLLYVNVETKHNVGGSGSLFVMDPSQEDRIIRTIHFEGYINNFIGDNQYLYLTHNDETVSMLDTSQNYSTQTIPVGQVPLHILIDNGFVYIENNDDGTLSVIDPSQNHDVVSVIQVLDYWSPHMIEFVVYGRTLIAVDTGNVEDEDIKNGTISLIDLKDKILIRTIKIKDFVEVDGYVGINHFWLHGQFLYVVTGSKGSETLRIDLGGYF